MPFRRDGRVGSHPDAKKTRRDGVRTNKVHGYADPDALPIGVTEDVLERLEARGFQLPAGYSLEVGVESENQSDAAGNLLLYLPLIGVPTVAILILSIRSVHIA